MVPKRPLEGTVPRREEPPNGCRGRLGAHNPALRKRTVRLPAPSRMTTLRMSDRLHPEEIARARKQIRTLLHLFVG
jgi:hypothetical protein